MAIEKELLDQLLAGRDPKDVFNKDGLVDELKKALSERILNTELEEHRRESEAWPPQEGLSEFLCVRRFSVMRARSAL
jgi:transposase-like protein